jgi:hypothetical protein
VSAFTKYETSRSSNVEELGIVTAGNALNDTLAGNSIATFVGTIGSVSDNTPTYDLISVPFTHNGEGQYYWKTTSLGNYVFSYNLDEVTINGTDYTNTYIGSENAPEKNDGYYYIYYNASSPWGYVEIK